MSLPPASRLKTIVSVVAALLIAAAALVILSQHLNAEVLRNAFAQLRSIPLHLVAEALVLVALSFLLAGLFEALALHKVRRALAESAVTPFGSTRAIGVALIANPIGHVLGFSTFTAGVLRFRIYAAAGLKRTPIAMMILLTALPYSLGITLLASALLILANDQAAAALHVPAWLVTLAGVLGLLAHTTYIALTVFVRRTVVVRGTPVQLPTAGFTLIQYVIGVAEILLIAGTLYLFMPRELSIGLWGFLFVYLTAVVLGQVSSLPAGLGVLEASLILMLPQVPVHQLIAAVLAYRVVFELIPLLASLGLLGVYEMASRKGIVGRLWRKPVVSG